jgi:hypothetical protein
MQQKKLTLKRETLRDLMAQNAAGVKGGAKLPPTYKKKCATGTCDSICYCGDTYYGCGTGVACW